MLNDYVWKGHVLLPRKISSVCERKTMYCIQLTYSIHIPTRVYIVDCRRVKHKIIVTLYSHELFCKLYRKNLKTPSLILKIFYKRLSIFSILVLQTWVSWHLQCLITSNYSKFVISAISDFFLLVTIVLDIFLHVTCMTLGSIYLDIFPFEQTVI